MSVTKTVERFASKASWRAVWFAVRINAFGVALAALWTPLNTLVLPDLVRATAPPALRGSVLGLITLLGTGVGALVQPVAGRMSDRAPLHDRRRPFIVVPTALALLWLAGLWWAPAVLWLLGAYVLLQATMNVAQAAFQGLIPSLVKEEERGLASGVQSGLNVVGIAVGLAAAGGLLALGLGNGAILLVLAVILLAGIAEVVDGVPRVPPLPEDERAPSLWAPLAVASIKHTFVQLFHAPRAFRRGVLGRFLFLLGAYPVQTFLLYFLRDRFGLTHPGLEAAFMVLGAAVLATLGAAIAGLLSDQLGERPVLLTAVGVGAAGIAGIAFASSLVVLVIPGALVAVGFGAFLGSNWALLNRTIPKGQGAQFLGLANLATAGAGALAGLLGPIVDLANAFLPGGTYRITFGLAAAIALTSILPLRKLRDMEGDGDADGRGRSADTRKWRT